MWYIFCCCCVVCIWSSWLLKDVGNTKSAVPSAVWMVLVFVVLECCCQPINQPWPPKSGGNGPDTEVMQIKGTLYTHRGKHLVSMKCYIHPFAYSSVYTTIMHVWSLFKISLEFWLDFLLFLIMTGFCVILYTCAALSAVVTKVCMPFVCHKELCACI